MSTDREMMYYRKWQQEEKDKRKALKLARTGLAAIIVALEGDEGPFGHDTALQTARDTLARLDQA